MQTLKKQAFITLMILLILVSIFQFVARRDLLGGEKVLKGAKRAFEDVTIRTEGKHGMKYVEAQTYEGAMYGLGMVHARDRLWQMYFFKMIAQGRVSEIAGNDTLELDIMVRNIGFHRIAKNISSSLNGEERKILQSYADGVNDFVDSLKWYPIEFYIMWTPAFETWTVEDSLCFQVLFQYFVSFDWFLELTRQRLTEIYDKELVDRMLPFRKEDYFYKDTELINDAELKKRGFYDEHANLYDIDESLLYFRNNDQPKKKKMSHFEHENWHQEEYLATAGGIGSNCWSVSGKHTETGKPLLSCDPHLNKQLQSMWYLTAVSWKESLDENTQGGSYVVGGSVVGLPVFSYGRSKYYAWGATALNPDIQDLFVEKIVDGKYEFDGEMHDFKVINETFKVRMGKEFTYSYKFTHHGALLFKPAKDELGFSVWFPLEFLNQNNDLEYSFRWVYSEGQPSNSYTLQKELLRKKLNLTEIEKILEGQNMFPLNLNFATSDGSIGYHMTGLFPKRKYAVHQGVYPKKGWLKDNLWEGFIDPKEHPRMYDPEEGFIVSANNHVASENCKHGLSHAFSFTQRYLRLKEMFRERIASKGKLGVQDMIDAQLDTLDIQARDSMKYIIDNVKLGLDSAMNITQKSGSDRVRMRALTKQSFALLDSWNYHMDLELIQPSLFAAFEFNFATYFQESKIDDADVRRGIHGNVIIENFFYKEIHRWATETDPRQEYCLLDDYLNAGMENNCHEFMAYVYLKALEDLNNRLGPDIQLWKFSSLQHIAYEHVPLSKTPFKPLYETVRPMAGNRHTPNVAIYFFHKTPYSPRFGPVIRMISDLADESKVYAALDTGLEQRYGSAHMTDLVDAFHNGEYLHIHTTEPSSKWPKGEETKVLQVEKPQQGEAKKEEF